ncbi:hypothetical protein [Natronomonas marina]|jgi:hypothetical protein|uniref:hypothetical protein n=1 Tax=Natronomonas marina TaxID=2961939 RepID=UPI0020CA11FC|nr:hypothetical protein [Natronomonas marina]
MVNLPFFTVGLLMTVLGVVVALNARADVEVGMRMRGIRPAEVTETGKERATRRTRIASVLGALFGVGMLLLAVL